MCIVSVMGDHAGQSADVIFKKKETDIEQIGRTFWLMRSPEARPAKVQELCNSMPAYTIFVAPASKGGPLPTKNAEGAREYSND
jgi:hypothetical protein